MQIIYYIIAACLILVAQTAPAQGVLQYGEYKGECTPRTITSAAIASCLPKMNAIEKRIMVDNILRTKDPSKNLLLLSFLAAHLTVEEKEDAIRIVTAQPAYAGKLLSDMDLLDTLTRAQRSEAVKGGCKSGTEFPEQAFNNTPYQNCSEVMEATEKKDKHVEPPPKVAPPPKKGFGYSKEVTLNVQSPNLESVRRDMAERKGSGVLAEIRTEGKLGASTGDDSVVEAVKKEDAKTLIRLLGQKKQIPERWRKAAVVVLAKGGNEGIRAAFVYLQADMNKSQRGSLLDAYITSGGDLKKMLEQAPLFDEEAELLAESATSRRLRRKLKKIKYKRLP